MNAIQLLSSQPWVERLGWTLVHFLWQGVLIAALYAAARRWIAQTLWGSQSWLQPAFSRLRATKPHAGPKKPPKKAAAGKIACPTISYILACAALAAMMAAPLVTWSLMRPSDAVPVPIHLTDRVPFAASPAAAAAPVYVPETGAPSVRILPWVVAAWLAGAVVFWMRLIAGWMAAARMRSMQVRPAPLEWQQTMDRLKARIGVSRPVRLLISGLAQAPAVVGWLKPVVLVPVGSLAGLPTEQIEALLIHELAHIRRRDYLVNILQSVAEALLFYHPAVWWVSGHIRAEREMCCDDVAVSLTGDAFTYASALAEIEASRPAHLRTAMAANGGSLADRIGRLLGQSRPISRTLPGTGGMAGAILLVATACALFGQSADSPRFDVASIKPAAPAPLRHVVRPLSGGLHVQNASVQLLMQNAYGLQPFEITGGPAWIESASYDIEAKSEGSANQRQVFLMLQSLLEDRFKLKVHRETKELPAYALTAARSGLKLPPPKEGDCVGPNPDGLTSYSPGTRMAPPGAGPLPVVRCGSVSVALLPSGAGMQGGKIPMPEFIRVLSMALGSPVIDRTGFTQLFDVRLDFQTDEITAALPPPPPGSDNAGPSILNALQQQLGLKLESTKGPVEVLVIDHVERPAEN